MITQRAAMPGEYRQHSKTRFQMTVITRSMRRASLSGRAAPNFVVRCSLSAAPRPPPPPPPPPAGMSELVNAHLKDKLCTRSQGTTLYFLRNDVPQGPQGRVPKEDEARAPLQVLLYMANLHTHFHCQHHLHVGSVLCLQHSYDNIVLVTKLVIM